VRGPDEDGRYGHRRQKGSLLGGWTRGSGSRRAKQALRAQAPEQYLPPFAVAPEKNGVGKAVTGGMLRRNAIPAAMDHGHTCVDADGLECDLDLGVLAGPERRLAPTEDKPLTWPPDPNAADLEDGAVGQCFDEAPALTGLEGRVRRASGV
jgi:hypothetical protein